MDADKITRLSLDQFNLDTSEKKGRLVVRGFFGNRHIEYVSAEDFKKLGAIEQFLYKRGWFGFNINEVLKQLEDKNPSQNSVAVAKALKNISDRLNTKQDEKNTPEKYSNLKIRIENIRKIIVNNNDDEKLIDDIVNCTANELRNLFYNSKMNYTEDDLKNYFERIIQSYSNNFSYETDEKLDILLIQYTALDPNNDRKSFLKKSLTSDIIMNLVEYKSNNIIKFFLKEGVANDIANKLKHTTVFSLAEKHNNWEAVKLFLDYLKPNKADIQKIVNNLRNKADLGDKQSELFNSLKKIFHNLNRNN